jgi:hypothetical protein
MATRRDNPKEKLWKTAVNAFISVLRKALICDTANSEHHVAQENLVASGTIRSRFWKEVADVYDKFMVGACVLEADEQVENMVLCFLTDELLTCCQDAPREVRMLLIRLHMTEVFLQSVVLHVCVICSAAVVCGPKC